MNERLEFVRGIYQNPTDDTRRLVYADWLDENGEGDLDVATAEFIRAACSGAPRKSTMRPEGYEWIQSHWKRLLPNTLSLVADDHRLSGSQWTPMFPSFKRTGRNVKTQLPVRNPYPKPKNRVYQRHLAPSCHFSFWKGFLVEVDYWHPVWADVFYSTIRAEAPMLDKNLNDKAGSYRVWSRAGLPLMQVFDEVEGGL